MYFFKGLSATHPNKKLLKSLSKWLSNKLQIWVIIMMLIESNMYTFTFNAFLQIQIAYSFTFQNKFSIILAILTLFILIIYSTTFYVLMKRYCKNSSEAILCIGKNTFKGFFLEMIAFNLMRCIRSSIHCLFLSSHSDQIVALLALDTAFIIILVLLRKNFIYKVVFGLYFAYLCCLFALDLFILLKEKGKIQYQSN